MSSLYIGDPVKCVECNKTIFPDYSMTTVTYIGEYPYCQCRGKDI